MKQYYNLILINVLTLFGVISLVLAYWYRPIKDLTDHLEAISYEKSFYFVEPYYQIILVLSISFILLGLSFSIRYIALRKVVNINRKFIKEYIAD